jgi:hypothetical protein
MLNFFVQLYSVHILWCMEAGVALAPSYLCQAYYYHEVIPLLTCSAFGRRYRLVGPKITSYLR